MTPSLRPGAQGHITVKPTNRHTGRVPASRFGRAVRSADTVALLYSVTALFLAIAALLASLNR